MKRPAPLRGLAAGGVARRLSERGRTGAAAGAPAPDIATALQAMFDQVAHGLGAFIAAHETTGTANAAPGNNNARRAVFGYSVRVGTAGVSAEPFGDLPAATKPAPGPAVRQPIVDVFEEADEVLVVAELPGVADAAVRCHLVGSTLHIAAQGPRAYAKAVTLPGKMLPDSLRSACANGILEVRLRRAPPSP